MNAHKAKELGNNILKFTEWMHILENTFKKNRQVITVGHRVSARDSAFPASNNDCRQNHDM